MTFEEALATQPAWVRIWVLWMSVITIATMVVLLFSKVTRRDALVIFLFNLGNVVFIQWLFSRVGYVRLLGVSHVIFWTPLVIYLVWRLRQAEIPGPFRQMIWALLATIAISLVIDYVDVARYLMGERAALAPRA